MKSACLLVYANKQDLKNALSSAEISDALALTSLSKTIQWHIQACCALSGEGCVGLATHGLGKLCTLLTRLGHLPRATRARTQAA